MVIKLLATYTSRFLFLDSVVDQRSLAVSGKNFPHQASMLSTIPLDSLQSHGIRGIVLDLDNTIVSEDDRYLSPRAEAWIQTAKLNGMKFFILSNGKRHNRVSYWSDRLGIPGMSRARKPFPFAFRKALQTMQLDAAQVVVIGDSRHTDVLGAWLMGCRSIQVATLPHPLRWWERLFGKHVQTGYPAELELWFHSYINGDMSSVQPNSLQPTHEASQDCTTPEVGVKPVFDPHPSVHSRAKRCLDIVGAIVGVVITAFLAVPIAIAIKLDSPGPIFYSQIRCGYQGKPFRLWKFRSMVVNADQLKHLIENQAEGPVFKNAKDLRITRVGRFLRRTSLDELPQFWSVLVGHMSLVGTRPPTPSEAKQYDAYHWKRLNVRPGITGEWQVNGRSTIIDFETIVSMDLQYQKKWSIAYDLILIIKTLQSMITGIGAY